MSLENERKIWIERKWGKQVTLSDRGSSKEREHGSRESGPNKSHCQMRGSSIWISLSIRGRRKWVTLQNKRKLQRVCIVKQMRGSRANNSCHQMRGNGKWVMLSKRGSSKQVTLNSIHLVSILFRNIFWVPQPWNCLDLYIWIPWRFIWYLNCRVYCLLVGQCQRFHLERLKTKGFAWLFEIKVVHTLQ